MVQYKLVFSILKEDVKNLDSELKSTIKHSKAPINHFLIRILHTACQKS